jgi:hypothetical protein
MKLGEYRTVGAHGILDRVELLNERLVMGDYELALLPSRCVPLARSDSNRVRTSTRCSRTRRRSPNSAPGSTDGSRAAYCLRLGMRAPPQL